MKRDYERPSEWDGFILYKSHYTPIASLSNEQIGRLFRHLFEWQIDGVAEPEGDILIAFLFFVNQFRIDDDKRLEMCHKNQINGKLGGRPKKTERLSKNHAVIEKPNGGHNEKVNEKEKDNEKDNEKDSLVMPYPGDSVFVDTWNELLQQPKWRKKTTQALNRSLKKLGKYEVGFAIKLMEDAIEHGWQGIEFDDTPTKYEAWLQAKHRQADGNYYNGVEVITDDSQFLND